jgi:hypothetical protein
MGLGSRASTFVHALAAMGDVPVRAGLRLQSYDHTCAKREFQCALMGMVWRDLGNYSADKSGDPGVFPGHGLVYCSSHSPLEGSFHHDSGLYALHFAVDCPNYLMFKHIVPVRSNLWPELYFGNVDFSLHPLGSSMLYQREGESLFVEDMKGRALNFVRSNPGAFYRRTEQRVVAFWAQPSQLWPYPWLLFLMTCGGVVESMRRGKRWPEFLSVLLFYPLTYYVTHAFARFRYPIEPLMYALAAYFICELVACGQRWRAQSGTKPSGMEKPRYKAPGVAMRGRR